MDPPNEKKMKFFGFCKDSKVRWIPTEFLRICLQNLKLKLFPYTIYTDIIIRIA